MPSHTLCEKAQLVSDVNATNNKTFLFKCLDGTFIIESLVCDGILDCVESGDEGYKLCHDMCFETLSGKTLPYLYCFHNCSSQNCTCNSQKYFQCRKGGCIHWTKFCNHVHDCPYDLSDEDQCPLLNTSIFRCKNNQTVDASQICDGFKTAGILLMSIVSKMMAKTPFIFYMQRESTYDSFTICK